MKSTDLRRLLSTSSGRRLFFVSCFAGALWSALVLGNAYLIAEIIFRITRHQPGQLRYIALLAGLWAARAVFQSQFEYWSAVVASAMKQDLRTAVTSSPANYEEVAAARLSNVLTKGLNSLDIYLGRFIPQMIFATITPLAVIAVLFMKDLISGLIALITLPLIPLFGALIGRFSEEAVSKKWQTLGMLSTYFEDSLRGFITLKIFNRSKTQAERIGKMGDAYSTETMKVLRISFLSAFALELIATLSVAVIAVSIGLRLVSGALDFRTALIVLILAPEVYFPVRNAAALFHASQDGTEAMHELDAISRPPREFGERQISAVTAINWQEWKFLADSLIPAARIETGEMLFLVGDSGAGKTTFSKNVLGLAFDAAIRVENPGSSVPLTPEMRREWQKIVGWIPQNPRLASGSIRRQFTLLEPQASDAQIEAALAVVGLSMADLPEGLDTVLGRGGEASHAASGGQIRRIAVARALFRNPALVVADEPTADLDQASAEKVMAALRHAQRNGAMVLCITHDSSLLLPGDRLCRVERVSP